MRVTINDVAQRAGVSKATVSYVLNGDTSHVSAETSARVFAAMKELNYRPNAVARSLVRQRTDVIGIVVARIDRDPYPEAVRGISDTAREKGYNVLLISSEGRPEQEKDALNLLYERMADGMIIVSASGQGGNAHLEDFVRTGVPLAVINRFEDDTDGLHTIHIDNRSGTYAATEHLINLGHHRIACLHAPVDGPDVSRAAIERVDGFRQACAAANVAVNEQWVQEVPLDRKQAWQRSVAVATRLLQTMPRPTAFVCASDYIALGVLRAAHELGIRVPDDVAVVGHDNTTAATYSSPPLSSVSQPMYEAGVAAAEAVLGTLKEKSGAKTVTLPCLFIPRLSCGTPEADPPHVAPG